jgi:hypothetical protein
MPDHGALVQIFFEFAAPSIRLNPRLRSVLARKNMKPTFTKTITAIVAGLLVLGTTLFAQGTDSRINQGHRVIEATAITKADAEKKYPPPKGGNYPAASRDAHDKSGVVTSPYPPYQQYDCSKVNHGGLVLDIRAKHVFVYP